MFFLLGVVLPHLPFEIFGATFWGVDKRVVFQKGGFGTCSPRKENWNEGTFGCSPERKPERGYVRMFPPNDVCMFPRNKNRNEGTFSKTALLRNRPFSPSELLVNFHRFSLPSPGQFSQFSPDFSQAESSFSQL